MIPAKYWSPTKRLMLLGAMAGGKAVEDTATGNPLTFLTDLSRPLKSLLVPFTPQQEGTGDPSPSNIRPIVPWDGLTVWNGGKNLYDEATYPLTQGRLIWPGDGTSDANANYAATIDFIPCENIAGKKITLNKRPGGGNPGFAFYTAKTTGSRFAGYTNSGITAGTPWTITVPEGAKYMRFTVPAGATDIQLEAGDTATAYEPYAPITETDISFPSPVYGGILSVVSGVLRVQWAGFSATWGDGESATDMGSGITRKVFPMVDYLQTGAANNICNIAPYKTSEDASVHFYYSGSGTTNRKCRLFLPSDTPDSTEVTVVTKLSQFYEVQLTPSQITALVGNNTIWSDADGQMVAVYFKKG